MPRSWNHRARRLDPDDIDHYDRWGRLCTAGRRCPGQATHLITYDYVTGRAGRVSDSSRIACETHATRFATRHQVEIGDPVPQRPNPFTSAVTALTAFDRGKTRITVRRDAYGNWYGTESGAGFFVSHAYRTDLTRDDTLDTAIDVIERRAAADKRMVRSTAWQREGLTAVAEFVQAEDTDQWRDTPWTLRIHCLTDGYEAGTWVLTRQLDPRFRTDVEKLGHTKMDLDRAIRTAERELSARWTILDGWQRDGNTATATARLGPKPEPTSTARLVAVAPRGVALGQDALIPVTGGAS